MINSNTTVTFICTTIHVAINHKVHISIVLHTQKLDIMLNSRISEITLCILAECEYFYKLTCIWYITPKISVLRKYCHASVFICKIIYIFASDSQKKSTVADHRKRRIKNLGCRPLKIKQSDSCLVITHSVKICHKIVLCISIFILCRYFIFYRNARSRFINILDDRNPGFGQLRI